MNMPRRFAPGHAYAVHQPPESYFLLSTSTYVCGARQLLVSFFTRYNCHEFDAQQDMLDFVPSY
jgi:hypothetical protein